MIGVIHRWRTTCFLLIQIRREAVVTELHGPGEMVVQLQALHRAALQCFHHKTNEPLSDGGMSGIEPGHAMAAVQVHPALTIGTGEDPVGVLLHNLGRRRLHQPVLEPRHHLNAAFISLLHQGADRIDANTSLPQGRLNRRVGTLVKSGAATPDVRQHTVEPGLLKLLHRLADASTVVIERARAVGQPDACGGVRFKQSFQTRLSLCRRTKPKAEGKRQNGTNGTSN